MQQTNKYKLNLIESSDPFLPDGLNANTQKVEDAMLAHEAKVDVQITQQNQTISDLTQRLGVHGTTARFVCGQYSGPDGSTSAKAASLTFDFVPVLLVFGTGHGLSSSDGATILMRGVEGGRMPGNHSASWKVSWEDRTVSWYCNNANFKVSCVGCLYFAIGYDPV